MPPRSTSTCEKIFATLAAGLLAAGPAAAQCGPPEEPAPQPRDSVLVNPAWLAARLTDPALLVLHVDHDRQEYDRGHVPRARYVSVEAFYRDPDVELPRQAQLDSLLGALAIGATTRVVIVPGSAMMAARAFVALEYAGLRGRVHWLDGGSGAWRAAGRRLTTDVPPPVVPRRFTARVDSGVVVTAAWLRGRLTDRRVALLDTRSRGEYVGDGRDVLPRYGHVPGARWLEWSRLLSDPNAGMHGAPAFVESAVLRRLLADAGAGDGTVLVPYCTVGLRAAVVYLAARSLGLEVRLYDGSMAEWTRHPDFPLIRGDQR